MPLGLRGGRRLRRIDRWLAHASLGLSRQIYGTARGSPVTAKPSGVARLGASGGPGSTFANRSAGPFILWCAEPLATGRSPDAVFVQYRRPRGSSRAAPKRHEREPGTFLRISTAAPDRSCAHRYGTLKDGSISVARSIAHHRPPSPTRLIPRSRREPRSAGLDSSSL